MVVALASAACQSGDGADDDGSAYVISGLVSVDEGSAVPDGSSLVVIWSVNVPDEYDYKWGEGTIATGRFRIELPGAPPPEALHASGTGLAHAVVLPPDLSLPDGTVAEDFDWGAIIGATDRDAIVFRAADSTGGWMDQFPEAQSCGTCVPADEGFDSYEPIDCGDVVLHIAPNESLGFCNWS